MPDTRQPAKELWDSLSAEKSAPKQPAELRAKQDELRSETRELREDQAELLEDQEQLTEKKEELARREKAVALRELELKLPPPDDDEAAGDDDSSTFSRLQRAWFGASLMSVSAFANDTVVYINSSMWYWYITLFVFSFKSTPLCDENLQQPASQCEDDLDGSQYYFGLTGFMFVVFALVNMLARYYESVDEERVWSSGACVAGSDHLTPLQRKLVTLRQMTGMCTGWALGDAFKRAHEQVLANAAVGGWEQELGITELQVNFGFATFVTIAAAAVVAVTRPNARGLVQCDSCVGGTKPARAPSKEGAGGRQHSAFLRLRLVERYATTVFALVAKAVATAVMVIWTKVLSAWVVQGLDRRGAVPEGCAVDEVAMNELYEACAREHLPCPGRPRARPRCARLASPPGGRVAHAPLLGDRDHVRRLGALLLAGQLRGAARLQVAAARARGGRPDAAHLWLGHRLRLVQPARANPAASRSRVLVGRLAPPLRLGAGRTWPSRRSTSTRGRCIRWRTTGASA
jgi:hypothetical protein